MKYKPTRQEIISGTIASFIAGVLIWVGGGVLAFIWLLCMGKEFNFKDLFTLQLPLWFVLLVATIIGIAYWMRRLYKKPMPFLKVHDMHVGCYLWTWRWKYDEAKKQYIIYDLKPYCPQCGKILICNSYEHRYECISGHAYYDVEWSKAGNTIVEQLRSSYPEYRDIISFLS